MGLRRIIKKRWTWKNYFLKTKMKKMKMTRGMRVAMLKVTMQDLRQ